MIDTIKYILNTTREITLAKFLLGAFVCFIAGFLFCLVLVSSYIVG